MTYQTILDNILASSDNTQLAGVVIDAVNNHVGVRYDEKNDEIRNFMLFHASNIEERIKACLRFLEKKLEVQPTSRFDYSKGVVAGYFGSNNSTQSICHLLIGVANLSGILITIVENKVTGHRVIHKAVGVLISEDAKAQVTEQLTGGVKMVSTHPEILLLYNTLKKLSNHEPLVEVVNDPLKTVGYRTALYKGFWEEGKTLKEIQDAYIENSKPKIEPTP